MSKDTNSTEPNDGDSPSLMEKLQFLPYDRLHAMFADYRRTSEAIPRERLRSDVTIEDVEALESAFVRALGG